MRIRFLLGCLIAGPAFSAEAPEELQTVVITGTRIRGSANEHTAPVTQVSNAELTRGGNDSLGRALQSLPFNTGAPNNTNVNNGGDGATRVDLRGLTPKRTLVLLNGRRLPNGGIGADSSVDIDSIPLSMVDRVEVLTSGGSAVYGADAVGGVINVITRRSFDGLELNGQLSRADRGDGAISRAQLLGGFDLGDGEWMVGVDHVDQRGVGMGQRRYSAVPLFVASADGDLVEFGSSATPDGRFRISGGNSLGLPPGPYTRVPGATGQSASDWQLSDFSETFNYAPFNFLQTPNKRSSLWLTGQQPIGDDMVWFVEATASQRESAQALAPAFYFIATGSAPPGPDGRPAVAANSFYNPFGVGVFQGQRRLIELEDRNYSQRVKSWRVLSGIRGERHSWNWEFTVARADARSVTRENGVPLAARFVAGLGPSGRDAAGNIVCGVPDAGTGVVPTGAIVPDCVPINLFGGGGSITQQQVDFMAIGLRDPGSNAQTLANFSLDGKWGENWAGPIHWAFGGEYRRESGGYEFDLTRAGGAVGQGLASDTPESSFDAREIYAEVRMPLADTLDSTFGARLSDFSTFGTNTTVRAGLQFQPTGSFILRADFTQLFRAPNLAELFERRISGQGGDVIDPCGNNPTETQSSHCAADGVPGGSYEQDPLTFLDLESGGNPDLQPEEGDSFTAGVEWRPHGSKWNLRADYFHTRLEGYIENADAQVIVDECANTGSSTACANIQRFPDGSLSSIDTSKSNFGRVALSGIDVGVEFELPTDSGDFSARLLATHLLSHDTQTFEGGLTIANAGRGDSRFVLPRWRALASLAFDRGAWHAGYTGQFVGSYESCSFTLSDERYCARTGTILYHDVEAGYRFDPVNLRAGVNNLGDRDPPFLFGEANTSPATYRLLGRTWFFEIGLSLH